MNQSSGCLPPSVSGALFAVMHWKYQIVNSLFPTKSIKQLTCSYNPLHINPNMLSWGRILSTNWSGIKMLSWPDWLMSLCVGDGGRPRLPGILFLSSVRIPGKDFALFQLNYSQNPTFSCQWRDITTPHQTQEKWLESNEWVCRWKVVFNRGLEAGVTLMKHDKRRKSISNQWRVYLQWLRLEFQQSIFLLLSRLSATLNQTRVTWLPHLQRNSKSPNCCWDGSQTFPAEQILWKSLRKLGGVSSGPAIREGVCLNNIILPPRVFLAY